MSSGSLRLTPRELNALFIDGLKDAVTFIENPSAKPLVIDVKINSYIAKLRVYLFNCTNPPGGRASDEYKSQIIIPGQARGQRGNFPHEDGRFVILGAYTTLADTDDSGVFVFWDAMCHENFSYSANVQVKSEILVAAMANNVSIGRKNNNETIVACRKNHLLEGIEARLFTVSYIK